MIRNQRKILELKGIITEINKLINEFNWKLDIVKQIYEPEDRIVEYI